MPTGAHAESLKPGVAKAAESCVFWNSHGPWPGMPADRLIVTRCDAGTVVSTCCDHAAPANRPEQTRIINVRRRAPRGEMKRAIRSMGLTGKSSSTIDRGSPPDRDPINDANRSAFNSRCLKFNRVDQALLESLPICKPLLSTHPWTVVNICNLRAVA